MENNNRKYYTAYEERYKTAHEKGVSWSSDKSSPIVMKVIEKYNIQVEQCLLEIEMQSDINNAFELQEREHESGKMMVAGTSCRMVSFKTFEEELERNHLEIVEKGITSALADFKMDSNVSPLLCCDIFICVFWRLEAVRKRRPRFD